MYGFIVCQIFGAIEDDDPIGFPQAGCQGVANVSINTGFQFC